jgi:hypothetical protein
MRGERSLSHIGERVLLNFKTRKGFGAPFVAAHLVSRATQETAQRAMEVARSTSNVDAPTDITHGAAVVVGVVDGAGISVVLLC